MSTVNTHTAGTATRAFAGFPLDQFPVAGKTGTAQVDNKSDTAVFAAFGPLPAPQYAISVVLEESGPEVAKAFHDLLFDNQPSESGPFPDDDQLVEWAVEAGADEDAVRPGIEDMAFEGWVEAAGDAASKAGVNSTPTFLINGKKYSGAMSVESMSALFDSIG